MHPTGKGKKGGGQPGGSGDPAPGKKGSGKKGTGRPHTPSGKGKDRTQKGKGKGNPGDGNTAPERLFNRERNPRPIDSELYFGLVTTEGQVRQTARRIEAELNVPPNNEGTPHLALAGLRTSPGVSRCRSASLFRFFWPADLHPNVPDDQRLGKFVVLTPFEVSQLAILPEFLIDNSIYPWDILGDDCCTPLGHPEAHNAQLVIPTVWEEGGFSRCVIHGHVEAAVACSKWEQIQQEAGLRHYCQQQ